MDNSYLEVISELDRGCSVLSSVLDKWGMRCDNERLNAYPIGCLVRGKSENGFLMEGRVIGVKYGAICIYADKVPKILNQDNREYPMRYTTLEKL